MMRKVLNLVLAGLLFGSVGAFAWTQDRLIVAQSNVVTLDAAASFDLPSFAVTRQISETLFNLAPEGEIVPWLAESHELSEDGITWTFNLRQGVTFHDGTPFDAEAVRYNIERFLDPSNDFVFRFLLDRIEEIEVVDEATIQLTLSEPYAPLLRSFTHDSTAIQSPGAIEEFGEDYASNPVGTGPFRFVSWVRDQHIDLARYEDYWGEAPEVEEVRFLTVPDSIILTILVLAGDAHVALRVRPADIAQLEGHPDITVENFESFRTIYIYFNHVMEPFNDVRVRQAINYAVDKEEINDLLLGGAARPSDAPIAPGIFGYTPVGYYEYNPELARELLTEAGFENGFNTTLYSPIGRYLQDIEISEAIQRQLAEVDINVEIETLEWSAYLDITNQSAEENVVPMALLGWNTITGDADYGLYPLFHTNEHVPAGSNRSFYSNPEVDVLLEEGRTTFDESWRQELYADAMEIIWNDAPWLFLHSEVEFVAVRPDWFDERGLHLRGWICRIIPVCIQPQEF